ncbi:hypothetical protein TNCV_4776201 [Trichonephila clavipes]|nr:hypothetical protein TNCV_4776201 [Trichonephila clavipes]
MRYLDLLADQVYPAVLHFGPDGDGYFKDDNASIHHVRCVQNRIATAGSDVVQSGRPIFDDFIRHLWPYIGNNTANVVFQMVKRLSLIRIDQ